MANDALQVNPANDVQEHITVRGSDWLWAVFAIMLFTDLVVIGWHFMIPRGQRVFHQMAAVSDQQLFAGISADLIRSS